jgi:hypothetical protein
MTATRQALSQGEQRDQSRRIELAPAARIRVVSACSRLDSGTDPGLAQDALCRHPVPNLRVRRARGWL